MSAAGIFHFFPKWFMKWGWALKVAFIIGRKKLKFRNFLDAAQLILDVIENLTICHKLQEKNHWSVCRYPRLLISGQILAERSTDRKNFRSTEVVVNEWIEVREMLRSYVISENLNNCLQLQWKQSKYINSRCLNFVRFINYLAAHNISQIFLFNFK